MSIFVSIFISFKNIFILKYLYTVPSSRTPYRFRSLPPSIHQALPPPCNIQKRKQKPVPSFRHSVSLHSSIRSHTFAIELESSQAGHIQAKQEAVKAQSTAVAPGTLRKPSALCVCLFPQARKIPLKIQAA